MSAKYTTNRQNRKHSKKNFISASILVIFTLVFSTFIGTGAGASRFNESECYTVCGGDTLWSIADLCNTKNTDIRNVMDDIIKLNNMKGTSLSAGEIIVIPIY